MKKRQLLEILERFGDDTDVILGEWNVLSRVLDVQALRMVSYDDSTDVVILSPDPEVTQTYGEHYNAQNQLVEDEP